MHSSNSFLRHFFPYKMMLRKMSPCILKYIHLHYIEILSPSHMHIQREGERERKGNITSVLHYAKHLQGQEKHWKLYRPCLAECQYLRIRVTCSFGITREPARKLFSAPHPLSRTADLETLGPRCFFLGDSDTANVWVILRREKEARMSLVQTRILMDKPQFKAPGPII